MGGKSCPICESFVVKDSETQSTNRVRCRACYTRKDSYDFCWECMNKWRSSGFGMQNCGNPDCNSS